MNATLIPFLLATNLVVRDYVWQHGPEYTFSVNVNISITSDTQLHSSNSTFLTLCRPKDQDRLSCHLKTWEEDLYVYNLVKKRFKMSRSDSMDLKEMVFELEYDNKGIEFYIIPKNISTSLLIALKPVIDLFNVRGDVLKKSDDYLQDYDKFMLGECLTKFRVIKNWPRYDDKKNYASESKFKFQFISASAKDTGKIIEIRRERDLRNCTCLQNRLMSAHVLKSAQSAKIMTANNTVTISEKEFRSQSKITARKVEGNVRIYEEMTLKLQSINAAREKMPKLVNPLAVFNLTTDLFAKNYLK